IPIGQAKVMREGRDLSVVSYGRTAPLCFSAANKLSEEGYDIEVIDLRSLMPFDREAIARSVQKTGRFLQVNEDTEVTNFGEHLIRVVSEDCFYHLEAPPRLLAGVNTPGIGLSWNLERNQVPQEEHIIEAMRAAVATSA
ncbi:MAG: transketolase C-terminal domain-containing protein, partial [Myxococcota bacterium]